MLRTGSTASAAPVCVVFPLVPPTWQREKMPNGIFLPLSAERWGCGGFGGKGKKTRCSLGVVLRMRAFLEVTSL